MVTNLAIIVEPVNPDDNSIHDFEHIGSILRRLKLAAESAMTDRFDRDLSLQLDGIEAQAQALREEGAP